MIFIDTSAIYALADRDDEHHQEAIRLYQDALQKREGFVVHNYILVESAALLQRRLGQQIAVQFLHDAESFTIIWIDEELHATARQRLEASNSSQISLVDAISFHVMTRHGLVYCLTFDKHFAQEGFTIYTA